MKNNLHSTSLQIDVFNAKGEPIQDAKITIQPSESKAKKISVKYNRDRAAYSVKEITAGNYEIKVSHEKLEGQSRKVTVGTAPGHEIFILGERRGRTYFREKVRVPVDADPELVAVTVVNRARTDKKFLEELTVNMPLEPQKVPELAERAGIHLYRLRAESAQAVLTRLSEHQLVEHAGAVVSMRENGFSFLTREIVVRFRGPRAEAVAAIAREYGYTVVRELVYAPHTWVLSWNQPATLDLLDSIEKMAARPDVEWAEPNLYVTPELDSITPTDFLWSGLWDRQLIGVQDAWQHLQDAGLDTFGDPDILLAVWDTGVQSAGGVPTNADFQGNISNGAPKVFAAFDFLNMVPNNDNPWGAHGSGVAGVSVALANNPAPIAGPAYGLVGSAPNVQIMTIAGMATTDVFIGDQYIWMAGFNPQSTMPGFPAPLPRGADVITCSLAPGVGAPLSGTAKATLDFVTAFGRGGKGTMCFFSTGNQNANIVTGTDSRPYGAYEKCFGIAGTSFKDDGVTEIRAPFSGWGQIALCSPTQDALSTVHNPPTGFMPWSGNHLGEGNLISYATAQTTLPAATAVGATVLSVANVTGFAVNSVIYIGAIGANGSEPAKVTAVNTSMNQLTVQGHTGVLFTGGLLNPHAASDVVLTGPANHRNNFGGTSSATPLCAGVAALVLSANPALTYIEARQILRDTAVRFDLANTDPVGQWLDINGNPSVTSGLPPVRSGWYGYGRVNAAAAVQTALTFPASRDLVIRDNLSDTGTVAAAGAFWNSPDIWCRRLPPSMDTGALPPNYATAGPHQDPMRGQPNRVYARVRNNGTVASLDAWVRISVTHWPGLEFTYPTSFQPTNGPGDSLPTPMTPGTYFIGETKVTGLAPGADQIVNVEWPAGLIPPVTVTVGMSSVHWHPCLLVEITPHDGPVPTGNHVWDNNNLAQKNITIVGTDSGKDFEFATVIGNEENEADYLILEIIRGRLPKQVNLYVNLLNPLLRRRLRTFNQWKQEPTPVSWGGKAQWIKSVAARPSWGIGWHQGQEVVFLLPRPTVQVPVAAGKGLVSPLVVGGIVEEDAQEGNYEVVLIQRQPDGQISGSATLQITIGKENKEKQLID
ncbi:S8 family serine peptidase [Telluribacter sp. SYSU D00476]|uniref:S8 family serine peptidase n=1 Tax=Telluribacter sp. SYSU D00476 TaxID=2811430 RepID=UPI001FF6E450|nr:S8 family serine peptidase [Telluribacter sp. SYSU D00476]